VVADESEARFYDIAGPRARLALCGRVVNPAAHLRDRDLKSDRPGRVFDRAPTIGRRRGAVAHHSTGGERRPRIQQMQRFARRIAREIDRARRQDQFDRLVLMAGPRFLGAVRAAPHRATLAAAVQVPRNLMHEDEGAVRDRVPAAAFRSAEASLDTP
jgi:protein required for attachment to host cells